MNEFLKILEPVAELLKKKNTDYGNSFDHTRHEFGPSAFLLRLDDKYNRLKTLTKQEAQVNDESIEDTLSDIIGYCTLELRYRKNMNTEGLCSFCSYCGVSEIECGKCGSGSNWEPRNKTNSRG